MVRQECTYHSNFVLASIKEYYNGKLVKHETFTDKGETMYLFREEEYRPFWYEYVYKNGVIVWFWNSDGHTVTYNENGNAKSISSMRLSSPVTYVPLNEERIIVTDLHI